MVRLTDRPDMTLDVYRGRKTTTQQQQQTCRKLGRIKNLACMRKLRSIDSLPWNDLGMGAVFTIYFLFIDTHNYSWISMIRITDIHISIKQYPFFELVIPINRIIDIKKSKSLFHTIYGYQRLEYGYL